MQVFITRPDPDAGRFAEEVRAAGHDPVRVPLLTIRPLAADIPPADERSGLVFTSANGVRAFAARSNDRRGPVFVVGPASAAEACSAGFTDIRTAEGEGASLARLIAGSLPPGAPPLLHLSGQAVAGDLAGALAAAGIACRRLVLYEAVAVTRLPPALAAGLSAGTGVLTLFSARTARILCDLLAEAGLTGAARSCHTLCLSEAVAEPLRAAGWTNLAVAAEPRGTALIALL